MDASSNFQPFLSFLGMLRTKYLDRFSPQHLTFHSIVLAGVHDIKNLKSRIRPTPSVSLKGDVAVLNSPWNIASDFKVDMSFNPAEIAPMLVQYGEAEGVEMDVPALAEKLHYYTAGYPFLVSKLCKTIAEDILPNKTEKRWTMGDLEQALQLLLRENNTNFDSLIKNLENNPDLYQLVFEVIVNGVEVPFNPDEPVTSLGRLYGIFKENGMYRCPPLDGQNYSLHIIRKAPAKGTEIHDDALQFRGRGRRTGGPVGQVGRRISISEYLAQVDTGNGNGVDAAGPNIEEMNRVHCIASAIGRLFYLVNHHAGKGGGEGGIPVTSVTVPMRV